MTICESLCKLRPICSVYEKMSSVKGEISIKIENCNYIQAKNAEQQSQTTTCQPQQSYPKARTAEQINKVAQLIKEQTQEPQDLEENISIECVCAVCSTMTAIAHSDVCSVCGITLCGSCVVFSPADKPHCEDCWDAAGRKTT